MIELKYSAKRFGIMSEEERKLSSFNILAKISAITGWTVPASEIMLDILVDQLSKKLSENYSNLNVEEIEYAFRNKGIEVKDWGKSLSLTLLDEVLLPYLENRFELSRLEESVKKPVMIEENKEITDQEMFEWIDEWKVRENISIDLIPLSFYEFLEKKGILSVSKEQKWESIASATAAIKVRLQEDIGICKTNNAYIAFGQFEKMEKEGFSGEMKGRILNKAKRIILRDYLQPVKIEEDVRIVQTVG